MDSDAQHSSDTEHTPRGAEESPTQSDGTIPRTEESSPESQADVQLDEALEQVAHGATVSVPAILLNRGLAFTLSVILTNGFGASLYGLYVLANRLQKYLVGLTVSLESGINRFLPAASAREQDVLATFVSLLLLSVAIVFGTVLFITAPLVARVAGFGPQFQQFVRLFAVGAPATIWIRTVAAIYRGFEKVGPYNLILRISMPTAHLIVGVIGTFVFHDLTLVIAGIIFSTALVGVIGTIWLIWKQGIRPRIQGLADSKIRSRYVGFTIPLFLNGFATTTQRLGYYPLIILFLSDIAGGVFAIGVLMGSFVQLPMFGINQFIPPVAAVLHEQEQHKELRRLYQVTSRLMLIGTLGVAFPLIIYRTAVMQLFGPTFVKYALLLPGFIIGQIGATVSGSNGIFLRMTDHQRAYVIVNVALTAFLIITAIPVVITFGLPGLVAIYFLRLVANNGLQVATLYHLEDIQPFTRSHAKPLLGALPLAAVMLGVRRVLQTPVTPIVGTLLGLTVYISTLRMLGFTHLEVRLARSLIERYRETFHKLQNSKTASRFRPTFQQTTLFMGTSIIIGGTVQAAVVSVLPEHLFGLLAILSGSLLLVIGALRTKQGNYS